MGKFSQEERRRQVVEHKHDARKFKEEHRVPIQDRPPIVADCFRLGQTYGIGVGLYFKTLSWLRLLFVWLALGSVPFLVLINSSKFTSPALGIKQDSTQLLGNGTLDAIWDAPEAGVKVYPQTNLFTFTFAAIMDSQIDNGMLSWMNIRLPGLDKIGGIWRNDFLLWISIADAVSMAVFIVFCTLFRHWSRRFAKEVDAHTVEVSDYTIVVKGMPEVDPIQVGQHFSRFGCVMDVVLVKDFGTLLSLAAQATVLGQQRAAAGEMLGRHFARAYQRRVDKAEQKLKDFMVVAGKAIDRAGCPTKAIFVTFGTQMERMACEAACPKHWLASFFQHREGRFLQTHRFWVEQAKPPEDYIYENLSFSRVNRYCRVMISRLVVVAVLLLCAVGVTKLMKMSRDSATKIVWKYDKLNQQVLKAMNAWPVNVSPDNLVFVDSSFSDSTLAGSAAYCAQQLDKKCSQQWSLMVDASVKFNLTKQVEWAVTSSRFLKQHKLFKSMATCAEKGTDCLLSACYSCYCGGLAAVESNFVGDGDWLATAKYECSDYIDSFDLSNMGIRAGISVFVVVLNLVLKTLLQLLVNFEKHWTKSDKERAYAVEAFVSQLLNSVLVLLLVNAKMDTVSNAINSGLSSSGQQARWFQNLILAGSYPDFSPGWYENVGTSIFIVAVLNVVLTPGFAVGFWMLRKLKQRCLTRCVQTASQEMYNSAWVGDEFLLDYRVSDEMLNLWLLLMFGSGMPMLYLVGILWLLAIEIVDRHALTKLCRQPNRYGPRLPYLLLDVLPWAAACHCAFGLWMHTYFATESGNLAAIEISSNNGNAVLAYVAKSGVWARITQINGLPLLCLLLVHIIFFVLVSGFLYGVVGRLFEALCGCKIISCANGSGDGPHPIAFDQALVGSGGTKLCGTPTYRMPRHPMYKDMFSNPMYKPIWFKAFGLTCYTRLVSRKGGFTVTAEPVLQHATADLEETIAQMSPEVQAAAIKLAEGGDEGSLTSKGSKQSPRNSVASSGPSASFAPSGALRVDVTALAGYETAHDGGGSGGASPRGLSFIGGASPAGPSFSGGQRTSRMAPPGHLARLGSAGYAVAGSGCSYTSSHGQSFTGPARGPLPYGRSPSASTPPALATGGAGSAASLAAAAGLGDLSPTDACAAAAGRGGFGFEVFDQPGGYEDAPELQQAAFSAGAAGAAGTFRPLALTATDMAMALAAPHIETMSPSGVTLTGFDCRVDCGDRMGAQEITPAEYSPSASPSSMAQRQMGLGVAYAQSPGSLHPMHMGVPATPPDGMSASNWLQCSNNDNSQQQLQQPQTGSPRTGVPHDVGFGGFFSKGMGSQTVAGQEGRGWLWDGAVAAAATQFVESTHSLQGAAPPNKSFVIDAPTRAPADITLAGGLARGAVPAPGAGSGGGAGAVLGWGALSLGGAFDSLDGAASEAYPNIRLTTVEAPAFVPHITTAGTAAAQQGALGAVASTAAANTPELTLRPHPLQWPSQQQHQQHAEAQQQAVTVAASSAKGIPWPSVSPIAIVSPPYAAAIAQSFRQAGGASTQEAPERSGSSPASVVPHSTTADCDKMCFEFFAPLPALDHEPVEGRNALRDSGDATKGAPPPVSAAVATPCGLEATGTSTVAVTEVLPSCSRTPQPTAIAAPTALMSESSPLPMVSIAAAPQNQRGEASTPGHYSCREDGSRRRRSSSSSTTSSRGSSSRTSSCSGRNACSQGPPMRPVAADSASGEQTTGKSSKKKKKRKKSNKKKGKH